MSTTRVALPPGLYYVSATNYSDKWLTTKGNEATIQMSVEGRRDEAQTTRTVWSDRESTQLAAQGFKSP